MILRLLHLVLCAYIGVAGCASTTDSKVEPVPGSRSILLFGNSVQQYSIDFIPGSRYVSVKFEIEDKNAFADKRIAGPMDGPAIPTRGQYIGELAPPKHGQLYWRPIRLLSHRPRKNTGDVFVKVRWGRLPGWSKNPAYNLGYRLEFFAEYTPDKRDLSVLDSYGWKQVPVRLLVQPDGRVAIDGFGS